MKKIALLAFCLACTPAFAEGQPAQTQQAPPDPNTTITITFGELMSLMTMARAEAGLDAAKAQASQATTKIQAQLKPAAPAQ